MEPDFRGFSLERFKLPSYRNWPRNGHHFCVNVYSIVLFVDTMPALQGSRQFLPKKGSIVSGGNDLGYGRFRLQRRDQY